MRHVILLLLSAASAQVGAQPMYRCGNTFSQQPCGADAKQIDVPGAVRTPPPAPMPNDTLASPEVIENATVICRQRVTAMLNDPDSAKFNSVTRGALRRTAGNNIVRDYTLVVNAKNSFGGYTGPKRWVCSLDPKTEGSIIWAGPVE